MKVIIDDREQTLIKWFKYLNLPFEIKRLEVGDLCLGRAVIERKETGDFISSLLDGRLTEQVNNMLNNYEKCCIVIFGSSYQTLSEINNESVFGMLASICARTNINVISFENYSDLCLFSYKFLTKANENKDFNTIIPLKPRLTNRNLEILMFIDGISHIKGLTLISRFNEVKGVLQASKEELMTVKGIGETLANRIKKFANIFY